MKKYLPSLLLLVLVLITTLVFAQIGGQVGPPAPPLPGNAPPPAVPIDGGVLALLVGGIAYGAKKLHNKG